MIMTFLQQHRHRIHGEVVVVVRVLMDGLCIAMNSVLCVVNFHLCPFDRRNGPKIQGGKKKKWISHSYYTLLLLQRSVVSDWKVKIISSFVMGFFCLKK